jgi:hypothetical protein
LWWGDIQHTQNRYFEFGKGKPEVEVVYHSCVHLEIMGDVSVNSGDQLHITYGIDHDILFPSGTRQDYVIRILLNRLHRGIFWKGVHTQRGEYARFLFPVKKKQSVTTQTLKLWTQT